ncbi:hypothetical protein BIW11_00928 [Tropilaelaps mercedesae]|uniref:Rho GTPase-activating protein 7-like n=1 Tax=Tropilaelaps mercedesae TaxID=418985 RepID=A0A1V9XMB0_9ACAR|nr:hypothetical protein BIW11_00928 [Tropilaelaps mercedesae]
MEGQRMKIQFIKKKKRTHSGEIALAYRGPYDVLYHWASITFASPVFDESKLRRSGSERIRDAIIRKVDSFRRRRREARSRSPKSHKMGRPGGGEQDPSAVPPATLQAVSLPGQTPAGCLKEGQQPHSSPKFLSPKGKRRGECYDNQALLADLETCDSHSLTLHLNLNLAQPAQPEADVLGDPADTRRDSGVGSTLTRTSVGSVVGQNPPAGLVPTTWHCYPGPAVHSTLLCPDRAIPLSQLTACQHMILRKHALLRLTALMEKYSPPYKTGWAWSVPKFIKKMTTPNYKDKVTFGVPLTAHVQRSGYPLLPSIQTAMQFVASVAPRCGGIFRKPGVRSRIEKLRQLHETHALDAHLLVYESQQCYDVADMVKQYFRELPEGGLLTAKFSQTFLYIFMHIPEEHRLEALQCAVLILPDENREVLETLLCFLDEVTQASQQNGMTASNLALCFAPSIFQLSQATSPKRKRNDQLSGEREICENRAGNECLCKMIEWHQELFSASVQILQSARLALEEPTDIQSFLANETPQPLYKLHLDSCLHWLLHEVRLNKGWTQVSHPDLELAYKKVDDDYHYIRLWKCAVLVEAPPVEVLTRILRERHLWDDCLIKYRVLRRLDANTELCGFVRAEMGPHASREYLLMRTWRTDITAKGTCALIEMSVTDQDWPGFGSGYCHVSTQPSSVRAQVLASRYLVQPGGGGRSKVTHLARIDTRGRGGDWHNRSAGNIHAHHLLKMAQSFRAPSAAIQSGPLTNGQPGTGQAAGTAVLVADKEKETKL